MATQREIVGTFIGERRVFLNDAGTDFEVRVIVGEIETPDGDKITVKGEAAESALLSGLAYRFYGYTKAHQKYGEQFLFETFVVESPATQEAVVVYLRQCKGIGPATAYTMWDMWGEKSIDKLIHSPEEVAASIPRLSQVLAREASVRLARLEGTRRAKMDLLALLHGRGLPRKMIDSIVSAYGSSAAETIRDNPYRLMDFHGCGFLKADKIWLELGHDPAAMERQGRCVCHAISSASSGDTWTHKNVAKKALERSIGGAAPDFDAALAWAIGEELLWARTDAMKSTWLAVASRAAAEDRVSRRIAEAKNEMDAGGWRSLWPDIDSIERISDHQRGELEKATTGLISILAGSPGTGKTYCSAALIRAIIKKYGQEAVAITAPTGKAAVRVTEAMRNNEIDMTAKTIHTLLKVERGSKDGKANGKKPDEDGFAFHHGMGSPLPYQFVIIDESSMIDTTLMASLLSARGKGTHYLFIGDTNQLAPVGHGAPLRDMIAAGMPAGTLTEIQRNSGRIVRACAEIRDKQRFEASPQIDIGCGENLYFIQAEEPEEQIEQLQEVVSQLISSPEQKHDPIWDLQILVAVNKKSMLGRKPLNAKLQVLLNPHGQGATGSPFRVGDKVINTKNGWLPQPPDAKGGHPNANDDGKLYVANGEQGEVLQVETNKTIVRLENPDRIVLIPRGTQDDAEREPDDGSAIVREDEEDKQATGTGCNWELGFAISGHKSQGSEWQIVIVMIDEHPSAKMVCTRNWIYTAISRAKTLCLLVGKKSVAMEMCQRDGLRRKTFMVEMLAGHGIAQTSLSTSISGTVFRELGDLVRGAC